MDLEVVYQDEPIKAIKLAKLSEQGDFHAALKNATFKVEDEASCLYIEHDKNVAPSSNCSCGFYAIKPSVFNPSLHRGKGIALTESNELNLVLQEQLNFDNSVLLDVELWGKVIEHSLGYRAQYQRVLKATVFKKCTSAYHQYEDRTIYSDKFYFSGLGILRVTCEQCVKSLTRFGMPVYSLAELRNIYKTEIEVISDIKELDKTVQPER